MMRKGGGLAIAVVVWLTSMSASAQSGDAESARALFEQGVAAAAEERWPDAVTSFRASAALVERPATAYNLAVALDRLGRAREALAALDDYARLALPNDPRQADAATLRTQVQARIVTLRLGVSPPDATVEIDGEVEEGAGEQRSIAMDPGEHVLHVSAEGHEPQRVRVTAVSGMPLVQSIALESAAAEAEPVQTGGAPAPPSGGLSGLGVAGLAIAGVGVAAGVVAIVTGVVSNDTYTSLEQACGPDGQSCPPDRASDIDFGRSMAWTSTILTIAGGVALAAGVTLLVIDLTSGSTEAPAARLEITPGPSPAGLGARLRL